MKSNRSLSRFPLALLGVLVLAAIGFMAYLSTTQPAVTETQIEKEISLESLSDSMDKPAQAPAAAPVPTTLPVPEEPSAQAPADEAQQ